MKRGLCLLLFALTFVADDGGAQKEARDLDIIASDGVKLRATYFSPGKPGPAMLLLHQCNMDRKSWNGLAAALAQRGIHVLTFDYRGYGESPEASGSQNLPVDIDSALATLISRPGVDKRRLAVGGASCGVNNAVQLARRTVKIKALMLLSGPTTREGLAFLREHPDIAIFGAASAEEGLAVSSIKTMVTSSTNPASTMRELNNAGHGVSMFGADSTLLPAVADWMVNVL